LLAQIREYRPDVLYVFSGVPVDSTLLQQARKWVRQLVCQWSCPIVPNYPYDLYDLIVSAAAHQVEWFRSQGWKSEYLKLAFDDRVLDRVNTNGPRSGAVFIGSISNNHSRRLKLLEFLAQHIDFDFYAPGLKHVPEDSALVRCYRGQANGLEMYRRYAGAKIALHSQIDVSGRFGGAKRLYEATGAGALLITDMKDHLGDLFKVGNEVVAYNDPADCLEKIQYYLAHEHERTTIAKAGQERTLREHTYEHRMVELLEILG
jgi:hypothetical protein